MKMRFYDFIGISWILSRKFENTDSSLSRLEEKSLF